MIRERKRKRVPMFDKSVSSREASISYLPRDRQAGHFDSEEREAEQETEEGGSGEPGECIRKNQGTHALKQQRGKLHGCLSSV